MAVNRWLDRNGRRLHGSVLPCSGELSSVFPYGGKYSGEREFMGIISTTYRKRKNALLSPIHTSLEPTYKKVT